MSRQKSKGKKRTNMSFVENIEVRVLGGVAKRNDYVPRHPVVRWSSAKILVR